MYSEKIYFTKDQLERFLQEQSEKDRMKFNNMYSDKKHIDIIKIVDECIFKITDEIFEIYWNNKTEKEKNDKIKKKGFYSNPDIIFSEEQKNKFKKNLTDKEIEEYISNIKFENKGYYQLMKKRGIF